MSSEANHGSDPQAGGTDQAPGAYQEDGAPAASRDASLYGDYWAEWQANRDASAGISEDDRNAAASRSFRQERAAERRLQRERARKTAQLDFGMSRRRFCVMIAGGFVVSAVIGFAAVAHARAGEKVALTVNGTHLSQHDYERRLEILTGARGLNKIIDDELLLQFAASKGLAPSQAQLDAKLGELHKRPDYKQQLKDSRETEADLKRKVSVQLAARNVETAGVTVTEQDLRNYYNANILPNDPRSIFYTPEQARIEVILTPTRADADRAFHDLKRGIPFETVARTWSKDTSRDAGGVMPGFTRGRAKLHQVPELENAIFSLKPGETLGPREFLRAWWIIRRLERTPAVTRPFEAVKDTCRENVLVVRGVAGSADKLRRDFETFRKKSNIIFLRPE